MAWHEFRWHDESVPCRYSEADAARNRAYLERQFDADFVQKFADKQSTHPLVKAWRTASAFHYLQFNGLAEDLRLLENVIGFSEAARDLRDPGKALPTWHMMHSAALIERASPGRVVTFVHDDGSGEVPDFLIELDGESIPVETKLLTKSDTEIEFDKTARSMRDVLKTRKLIRANCQTTLVLRRGWEREARPAIISGAANMLRLGSKTKTRFENAQLRVFIDSPPSDTVGLRNYEALRVVAPVPEHESVRVLDRAKKASRQLRRLKNAKQSGLLVVGLSMSQSGSLMLDRISARMTRGRLRGISGVVLTRRKVFTQAPRRDNLDVFAGMSHPNPTHPLPSKVAVASSGFHGDLLTAEPSHGVRAYDSLHVKVELVARSSVSFRPAYEFTLTEDML